MPRRRNREQEREFSYHTGPRYYIKRGSKYMSASGDFNRTMRDAFFAGSRQVAEDLARRGGGKVVVRNSARRETRVERRVRKALKKYVRKGNPHRGKQSMRKFKKVLKQGEKGRMSKADWRELRDMLGRDAGPGVRRRSNPPRVKGRKVKGGRAVTVRNFTGTIVKKSDGTVQIVGKGRRK